MKHTFIVNPVAGKGKALKYLPEIEKSLKAQSLEYSIHMTEQPLHATRLAAQLSDDDICYVYSVGGDGTLNEVVNGLVDKNCYLGIIPAGTGNDFVRNFDHLNIADEGDTWQRFLGDSTQVYQESKAIDIGRVNGKLFVNIASAGFDGQVAHETNRLKRLPLIGGKLAYYLGIVITLLKNRSYKMKLEIDGKILDSDILLVAVANGKYYGGGMMAAPKAKLDDGLFDVCVVQKLSRRRILRFLPKFIKGQHEGIKGVSFYKARKVDLWCKEGVPLNMDGEVELATEAHFELLPEAIKMVNSFKPY